MKYGVSVDVEALRVIRQAEVDASRMGIEWTEGMLRDQAECDGTEGHDAKVRNGGYCFVACFLDNKAAILRIITPCN